MAIEKTQVVLATGSWDDGEIYVETQSDVVDLSVVEAKQFVKELKAAIKKAEGKA